MDSKINEYIDCLKVYNEHTNVYSKKAYDQLGFHIQDSLCMANMIENKKKVVVDMGSGSGLPAICIAIQNPLNKVYAVESRKKKIDFLNYAKLQLGLENLVVHHGDVASFISVHQGSVDYITAKAFKPIPEAYKWARRFRGFREAVLLIPVSDNQLELYPSSAEYITRVQEEMGVFLYLKIPLGGGSVF